jgi:hypothetical protein
LHSLNFHLVQFQGISNINFRLLPRLEVDRGRLSRSPHQAAQLAGSHLRRNLLGHPDVALLGVPSARSKTTSNYLQRRLLLYRKVQVRGSRKPRTLPGPRTSLETLVCERCAVAELKRHERGVEAQHRPLWEALSVAEQGVSLSYLMPKRCPQITKHPRDIK